MTERIIEPDLAHAADQCARHRIVWLVGAHAAISVATVLATDAAYRHRSLSTMLPWLEAVLSGIVFGQTTLLGTWAGLGTSGWWKRLFWVSVGIGCILLLLTLCYHVPFAELSTVAVLSSALVAMVVIVLRIFGTGVQLQGSAVVVADRLQFSVRQLMIVTVLVGVAAAVGREIPPDYSWDAEWLSRELLVAPVVAWFGMVPVWPALATDRPGLCSFAAVVLVVSMAYGLERFAFNGTADSVTVTVGVQAMVVAVSLLVIRSCGYRLTR